MDISPTKDIHFSEEELIILNNALNEVCNGIHLEDVEFGTRMGATREEGRAVLRKIGNFLETAKSSE